MPDELYRFGPYLLNVTARELEQGERPVEIKGKPLNILIYLVKNPGIAHARQTLIDNVWGVNVTDGALTKQLTILRAILNDDIDQPNFIKTGDGFVKFIAGVERLPEASELPTEPKPAPESATFAESLLTPGADSPERPGQRPLALISDECLDLERLLKENWGGTVRLKAREYRVDRSLEVAGPITIIGAGQNQTRIIVHSSCDPTAVSLPRIRDKQPTEFRLGPNGPIVMRDLSVTTSENGIGQMYILSNDFLLERCGFSLMRVAVGGVAQGELRGCDIGPRMAGIADAGLHASDRAKVVVNGCTIIKADRGIDCSEDSAVTIQGTTIRENYCGIQVTGRASLKMSASKCLENGTGLAARDDSCGSVRDSSFVANSSHGVVVTGRASLELEFNKFELNRTGVGYSDSARGVARQNEFRRNQSAGIHGYGQPGPTIEDNIFIENQGDGIVFDRYDGSLALIHNTCRLNAGDGIRVARLDKPSNRVVEIRNNICQGNRSYGLEVEGPDLPPILFENNQCTGNRMGDFRGVPLSKRLKTISVRSIRLRHLVAVLVVSAVFAGLRYGGPPAYHFIWGPQEVPKSNVVSPMMFQSTGINITVPGFDGEVQMSPSKLEVADNLTKVTVVFRYRNVPVATSPPTSLVPPCWSAGTLWDGAGSRYEGISATCWGGFTKETGASLPSYVEDQRELTFPKLRTFEPEVNHHFRLEYANSKLEFEVRWFGKLPTEKTK